MLCLTEMSGVVEGRVDCLLVPVGISAPIFAAMGKVEGLRSWPDRLGLAGVEIKMSRDDFRNGLSSGQFDRYRRGLSGLYVAGPRGVVLAKELPPEVGILHVGMMTHPSRDIGPQSHCVCRRHPKWTMSTATTHDLWRVLWRVVEMRDREFRALGASRRTYEQRLVEITGRVIGKAIKEAALAGLEKASRPGC